MRLQVRQTLLAWLRGAGAANTASVPPFIRNKIAQLVVFIIQVRRNVNTYDEQATCRPTETLVIEVGGAVMRSIRSLHLVWKTMRTSQASRRWTAAQQNVWIICALLCPALLPTSAKQCRATRVIVCTAESEPRVGQHCITLSLNSLSTRCPLMNELENCAFVNSDPSVHHTQVEFPTPWQSAFQDIIGLLADGEGAADMFCRVLTAVDEDVISLEIPR